MASADTQLPEAEPGFAYGADTDAPLAERAARGVAWVAGARLAIQVAQFGASLVLARLLLPSQYGLAAIAWTVTSFAFLFNDLGLSAWLVQTPRIDARDASTAFYINLLAGLTLTVLLLVLSGPLAALFGHRSLAPLLRIASISFTISVTAVPNALLERRLQFGKVSLVDMASSVVGFSVTVVCAARGVGAASLVIGPVAGTAIASLGSLFYARWIPSARPSRSSARKLLGFGGHLTGFNFIAFWALNLDNLVIGRFVGATQLGFYNRAYMLMLMPVQQVSGALGRVLLPVLSAVREDPERMRRAILRVCRTNSVLLCPVLIGLAAVSHNFILVAFGHRWLGTAPLLAILCLSGPPQVAAGVSGLVAQAAGRPRLLTTWGNLSSLSLIVAIVAGLPWGAEGVCIAYTARAYLIFPVAIMPTKLSVGIGTADIVRASGPAFYASILMAGYVLIIGMLLRGRLAPLPILLLQILVGAAAYIAKMWLIDQPALLDVRTFVRNRRAAAA
ncbi:MAG TPA: lipopolysaccharide biosynthesis protein [Solirubrobacteraceae bacterium]|jgi:PST family polysaccharide transporter|nr:lipopolysaccharide biosynthesis protein [Solirubrobacteraceae bacterium]